MQNFVKFEIRENENKIKMLHSAATLNETCYLFDQQQYITKT